MHDTSIDNGLGSDDGGAGQDDDRARDERCGRQQDANGAGGCAAHARIVVRNYRALRRRLDGKTVLRVHQLRTELDPTLDELWSLIDDQRSVEQLGRLLAARHGFEAEACIAIVGDVLELFAARRLVSFRDPSLGATAAAAQEPPPAAPDLQRTIP